MMLNVPVTDGIAARLVIGAITNDGFRRTPDDRALDDEYKLSARLQTIFGLGSETTLLLSADVADQDLAQGARFNVRVLPFRTDKPRGFDDINKPRIANRDIYGGTESRTGGARAELNSDVLGFATLTATAAWRTLDFDSLEDFDGTTAAQNRINRIPVSGIQVIQAEQADSYSGEARLISLGDGPLSWVAGLYYNRDDIQRQRESQTSVTPTTINLFNGVAKNRSYAAFGEAQYKFDFGLGVFGGARYTDEKKVYGVTRLTGSRAAPTTAYSTVATPGETRQKLVTYRVGADYRFNRNVFVFGTVSTGFKSGAFQETPGSAILARIPTAPEKVTNYEVGIKTDLLGCLLLRRAAGDRADRRAARSRTGCGRSCLAAGAADPRPQPVGRRALPDLRPARNRGRRAPALRAEVGGPADTDFDRDRNPDRSHPVKPHEPGTALRLPVHQTISGE